MSGRIKISANELEDLHRKSMERRRDVEDITRVASEAVSGRVWQSSAATSFEQVWNRDKDILRRLGEDLESWAKHCQSQAPIARRVNEPFRT